MMDKLNINIGTILTRHEVLIQKTNETKTNNDVVSKYHEAVLGKIIDLVQLENSTQASQNHITVKVDNLTATIEENKLKLLNVESLIEKINNGIDNCKLTAEENMTQRHETEMEQLRKENNELSGKIVFLLQSEKNKTENKTEANVSNGGSNMPAHSESYKPYSNDTSFSEWQDGIINMINLSNLSQQGIGEAKNMKVSNSEGEKFIGEFHSCFTLKKAYPWLKNGIYRIFPSKTSISQTVYCDLESDGGGWTVYQRRGYILNGTTDFNRNWDDYSRGFGNPTVEDYWLGLEALHDLTKFCNHESMITGVEKNGPIFHLSHSIFKVASSSDDYELTIDHLQQRSFDLGDHSNQKFTTFDKDNDQWPGGNCAANNDGGWWYNFCYLWNPNKEITSIGLGEFYVEGDWKWAIQTELKIRSTC